MKKIILGSVLAVLLVGALIACTAVAAGDTTPPTVSSVLPADKAVGVTSNAVKATFSEALDPATVTTTTFTLYQGLIQVAGTTAYSNLVATFTPSVVLNPGATYTATITTGVKDVAGNALAAAYVWNFTIAPTGVVLTSGATVNLGTAGNYEILAKTGVSTTGATTVVGDIGLSPAAASYLTGFHSLTAVDLPGSNIAYDTATEVTAVPGKSIPAAGSGFLFAADMAGGLANYPTGTVGGTSAALTTAISDMQTAYTAANGVAPDVTELGAGNISGMTLAAGVYKWGTGLTIQSDVTLTGSSTDVWIFQIAQGLTVAGNHHIILSGNAQAKNIFWVVASGVDLQAGASFYGNILCMTNIALVTGATVTGRLLSQTAVTLQANTVTSP